jgi:predicted nucleic acid-binding protein
LVVPNPYTRPYLDSSVYIAAIKGDGAEPGRGDISAQVIELARQGHFQIVASTFVVAEVIKDGKQPPLSASEEAAIDGFLQQPFIEWVEVDLLVAKAARGIARQHGLKPVDAIHLATAVRAGADQFLTWDPDFPDGAVLEGVTCVRPHLVGLPQPLEGFPSND